MRKRARQNEIRVRETNKSPEKSIVPPRDKSNDKVIRLDIKSKTKKDECKE